MWYLIARENGLTDPDAAIAGQRVAGSLVSSAITQTTQAAFTGGKINYVQIIADGFGNPIAQSALAASGLPANTGATRVTAQRASTAAGESETAQDAPLTNNQDLLSDFQPQLQDVTFDPDSLSLPSIQIGVGPEGARGFWGVAQSLLGSGASNAQIQNTVLQLITANPNVTTLHEGDVLNLGDGSISAEARATDAQMNANYQAQLAAQAQAQAAAQQAATQEQQAGLAAFNEQADRDIEYSMSAPTDWASRSMLPLDPVDAFFSLDPLGEKIAGLGQSIRDLVEAPGNLSQGIGNLMRDAWGFSKEAVTGTPYQAQNSIVQLYQQEGAVAGSLDLTSDVFHSMPVVSVFSAPLDDPFAQGRALGGTLFALGSYGTSPLDDLGILPGPRAEGNAATNTTGQLARNEALLTEADPARDVLGPATLSHPEEIAQMRQTLEAAGVEVVDRPGAMAYSPGLSQGTPGQMVIDPEASYSAWLHEYQHAMDDQAIGWGGMRTLGDGTLRPQWEMNAYNQEMDLMSNLGHTGVVDQLQGNLAAELAQLQELFGGEYVAPVAPPLKAP